jgi:hypothetical protein
MEWINGNEEDGYSGGDESNSGETYYHHDLEGEEFDEEVVEGTEDEDLDYHRWRMEEREWSDEEPNDEASFDDEGADIDNQDDDLSDNLSGEEEEEELVVEEVEGSAMRELLDYQRLRGRKWSDIASGLQVSRKTLYRWRKRNNYVDPSFLENNSKLEDSILEYRAIGFKWDEICTLLEVKPSWIKRWRATTNFMDPNALTDITDTDLDAVVARLGLNHPQRGEKMLGGYLRSLYKIIVTRTRLRASITRVDPAGRAHRSRRVLKRRAYISRGPHYVWHIDGNHKLDRYNFVVEGGIDGCTRTVVFLKCADNNTAHSCFEAFLPAIDEYQCPMQIRIDKGGENIDIAKYMTRIRGKVHIMRPVVAAKSTDNQRIERLWRDVTKEVLDFYK